MSRSQLTALTEIPQCLQPLVVRLGSVHVSDELGRLEAGEPPGGETEVGDDDSPVLRGEVGDAGLVKDVGHDG